MIYKRQVYILVILLIHCSLSGITQHSLSTIQLGSGGTKSITSSGMFNLLNPVSTLSMNQGWAALASSENRFFAGIHSNFILLGLNKDNQGFTFGFHDYGIDGYSLDTWSIAYSRKLSPNWQLGTRMKLFTLNIQESPNQYEFNVDLSIELQALRNLKLSLLAENLNTSNAFNRSYINFGAQLSITEKLIMHAELQQGISKSHNNYSTFVFGMAYQMIENLRIFLGINTAFQGPSIGLHYDWNRFSFSIGLNNHNQLGRSGSFSLGKRF